MKKTSTSESQSKKEVTLRESEQRYHTIMMSIGDGVISTDTEGRVEMMNPVAEELTGWKQEKAKGKLLEEIFHIINEDTRKTVENPVRRVMSEGKVIGLANHSVLIAKDGTEHPIADSAAPIRNEKEEITGVVLVFRDQTREREAHLLLMAELMKSQTALVEAQAVAHMGSWEYDTIGDVITGSKEFYRLFDVAPKDLTRFSQFVDRLHPDDRDRVQSDVSNALQKDQPYDTDYRVKLGDDGWRDINARGRVFTNTAGKTVSMVGTCIDITGRKQAEKSLRENEKRYRTTMMSIGDGVISTNTEGKVEMMNPVAEELTGWKQKEALGKSLEEIFHIINEETRKTVENPVRRVIREGIVVGLANHSVLIAKDGTDHPIADSGAPIRNQNSDITGVVLVFRDQTQERIAQKALKESERKFRETVKYLEEGYYCVTPEGLLLDYNQAFIRILGFELTSDMRGVKLPDFWQKLEDRKVYLEELITKGFIRNFQINAKKLNGEKVVIMANSHMVKDEKGGLVRIEGTFTDFTELKLMEAALKENESKYRSLFENAQVGMYRSKLDGSAILAVNRKLCEIFGYSEEEMLGNPATIRWADPQARDRMVSELRKSGLLHDHSIDIVTKSGEIRTCSVSIQLNTEKGYIEGSAVDITERKMAENSLRESEERFRGVFESNMLGTIFWDANGDIVSANDAFLEIVGYSREDLNSGVLKWKELTPPKYDKIDEEKLKELAKRGKIDPFEKEYIHKSGRLIPIIISAATLTGSETSGVAIILDITQRKQAEEALRESQEKYYYLYENSPVGMYHTKIDGSGIIEINDSACEMLGFKKEELIGQPSAIRWADPNRRGEILKIMSEHGVATNFDADVLKKDGTILSCLLSMKIFKEEGYIEGFILNISDRKQMEEALRESKARYDLAMQFSKDGLYDWNLITNEIYYSPGWKKMVGYEDDELVNDFSVWELLTDPEDVKSTMKMVNELIEKKRERFELDFKMKHKDGHWVDVLSRANAIFDEKGKAIRIVGTHVDITQRKQAEEEIRNLNTELEDRVVKRTAQLEASNNELEAFSYSVSHDLRAPLRHVSGYVELLNKHFHKELSEKGQHYLNSIADSVRLMGKLIDDLLRFSRTGRIEMVRSAIDMNGLIHEVKEAICKENPDRNIEWILGKLPSVYGDESMLRLVWLNLLNNAVKFTGTRSNARIEIGVNEEKKEWVFFVRDNGVGFDMAYSHKLFGVFQRLHPTEEYEGTGIGLANVRRIISRHGGRTWAEAEPDKGAVFYFSLTNK